MLTPRDPGSFKADVLRRAVRLERRRRRVRALVALAAVGALALSGLTLGLTRIGRGGADVALSTAGPPGAETVRARVLELPEVRTPWAVVGGGGRSMWVLDRGGDHGPVVRRFEDRSAAVTAQLPSDAAPEQVVAGTDGGLWMTDPAASRVIRVAADGRVTTWPTQRAPAASAVFAGERLWVAEPGAGRLTGVGTDGSLVARPLPEGTRPAVLALGPDGSVWFADAVRAVIGSVGASGTVTTYDLASPDERVLAMAAGPGPALWLLVRSDSGLRLGRVDGSGHVAEEDIEASSAARALTQGPDGSLWLTSGDGTTLLRRSFSALRRDAIDHPVRARSWALSTDGTIWAVDGDRNQLVELTAPSS